MLRIAHLTSDIDGRANSGTARVARELIHKLNEYEDISQTFVHFNNSCEDIYHLPNTKEIIIPVGSNWITKRRSVSFVRWCLIQKVSRQSEKFDVVHWHSSRLFPFFFLFPSRKTILTLHDVGHRILPNVNTFATKVYYWNARIFQRKIHKIIAVSKTALRDMELIGKFSRARLEYIYNGSNFGFLNSAPIPGFSLPDQFLLCVSRWQPHKNVEILVRAVRVLSDELDRAQVKLILVGKPVGNFDSPQLLISKYGLESQIFTLSDLSDENLAYLYDHALINIFPSLHEGFGLSVLEAMSRRCASMVHSETSTSEIAGDSAISIDMTNLNELVVRLREVLNDSSRIDWKRQLALQLSAQFTWQKSVEKLKEIYESD